MLIAPRGARRNPARAFGSCGGRRAISVVDGVFFAECRRGNISGHWRAVIHHGLIRTTEDVDILVEESQENFRLVFAGLVPDGRALRRWTHPQDFGDNLVVTIGAEVQVDVSTRAGKISCANAVPTSLEADIEGVRVP
jgi:hypothetical protein